MAKLQGYTMPLNELHCGPNLNALFGISANAKHTNQCLIVFPDSIPIKYN